MNRKRGIRKRILSALLSLMLVFSMMSGSIRVLAEEERVVYINSAADLVKIANLCRLDTYSQGKRFELMEDLNLSNSGFEGFATFGGTFDGNGHTISGLNEEYEGSNQGFFRYVQESGKIEDLNLVGTVSFNGSSTNAGALAGVNKGTIRGCSVTVSVDGANAIGGIAGINESTGVIDRCIVRGSISGEHYTGGVAGKNLGVISRCTNYASVNTSVEEVTLGIDEINLDQLNSTENVSVNTDTGGIAGFSSGSITDSTNRGRIGYQHVGYNIGGIVGRQSGYIENCYNYGTIHGRKDVAGIVGQMEPYLLLQYSEDTAQKLEAAFDELDAAMNQLMDDMDISSSNLTGHMDQVIDLLDLVRSDFTELSNQTVDYANGLSDSATDMTERIDLALNRTHGVLDTMQGASDMLTKSLDKMEDAVERIDDASDDGQVVASYLIDAIDELSRANSHLSTAITDARNVQNILQKKVEAEIPTTSENEETAGSETAASENTSETESSSETSSLSTIGKEELESVSKELESGTGLNKEELESISKELESVTVNENDIRSFLLRYFTEEELNNLEANLTDMGDQIQYASNALNRAFDDMDEMRPYLDSMAESGDAAERYLEEALGYMEKASSSLSDAFDKADTVIDALEGNDTVAFPKLDSGYEALIDSISDLCDRVLDVLKTLNSDADSNSKKITNDIRRINDCITRIEDILLDAISEKGEEGEEKKDENGIQIFEEATNEESEDILQGKLKSSVNYGTIEADIAVGGIAGNMAIEYDLDPEEDIHIQGENSMNFQYKTSTVLSDSINYGEITAKKDYAGGIIGKMDLGTARNCQSYGNVTSEGGNYVGGIAGGSSALIEDSYARCKLSGSQYVGGIAGLAYDMNHCYALIRIEEAKEFYGAIAGDIAEAGEVYENYFVSGEWDGIDRVSYAAMAMPVSYEQMVAAEGFPEEFTEFLLRFVADDTIVAEIPFHYGDSISADVVPEVPKKDGYYAEWENFEYDNLEFNEIIEAVYTKELTVISSEAKTENGKTSVLLLEGIFDEHAEVTVSDIRESVEISLKEQESVLSGWHVAVYNPEQPSPSYSAHIVKPEGASDVRLWSLQDGVWTELSYEESGSYLTFTMSGNTADICLIGVSHNREVVAAILAGILLLGVIAIIIRSKRKDGAAKRKQKKEELRSLKKEEKQQKKAAKKQRKKQEEA